MEDDQIEQSSPMTSRQDTSQPCQPIKTCRVCGARALGFNFGGLSCESCKAFFRRSAFPNIKKFICANNKNCIIDTQTRRFCCYCRFQKCLVIGMQVDKVLRKTDRSKFLKPLKVVQPLTLQSFSPLTYFEQQTLRELNQSGSMLPDEREVPLHGEFNSLIEVFHRTEHYVKMFINFAKCFSSFSILETPDQLVMIKKVFLTHLLLRVSFVFQDYHDGVPIFKDDESTHCLFLAWQKFEVFMDIENINICRKLGKFIQTVFDGDRDMLNLFDAVILFRGGEETSNPEFLLYYYHFYRHLLKRYLIDKYQSLKVGQAKFDQMMGKMDANLKEFVDKINRELLNVMDRSQFDSVAAEIYNLI